jgi:integrase
MVRISDTRTKRNREQKPKRPRGTGRVYRPKGCRFYYYQFWQNGKQYRVSSHSEVKQVAETLLNGAIHGRNTGQLPVQEQKKVTYAHLRQGLLDNYRTQKRKSLQVGADGEEYVFPLTVLDRFFGYPHKKVLALSITNDTVQRFVRERRSEGVSDATILGNLRLLKRMVNLAADAKKLSEVPKFKFPPKPEARTDFIREPQFQGLLKEMPAHLHPYMLFLFYQGVRSGEAARICWSQIDLRRAVYMPKSSENKTGDARFRPLADPVLNALKSLPTGAAGDRIFDTTNFRTHFENACERLGFARDAWQCSQCKSVNTRSKPDVPPPMCSDCKAPIQWHRVGLTIHGFRRSCVVFYRESGVNDAVIRQITGHKNLDVFADYSVADLEAMRQAMTNATRQNGKKRLRA